MKSKILLTLSFLAILSVGLFFFGCPVAKKSIVEGDVAQKVYIPPGQYDEFYAFLSGGFSGQLSVTGIPSGRTFRIIPIFSVYPENGYGYSEETKAFLNTSHGFIP